MSTNDNPYAAPQVSITAPGQAWLTGSSPGLARTTVGLSLVYYGIVIVLLCFMSLVAVVVFPQIVFVSMVAMVVAVLMFLIGPVLCLSVPSETGARPWIVGAVVFSCLGILMAIAEVAVQGDLPRQAHAAQLGASLISNVLFVVFMRRLATFIGRNDLAARATRILLLGLMVALSLIAILVLNPTFDGKVVLLLIPGLLALIVFANYTHLLNSLRLAIRPAVLAASPPSATEL